MTEKQKEAKKVDKIRFNLEIAETEYSEDNSIFDEQYLDKFIDNLVEEVLSKSPDLPKDLTYTDTMKSFKGTKNEVESKLLKDGDKGLRASAGKIRYDLLEPYAIEQVAKIFTRGADKYSDNNWLKGMKWSKMIASLERHLAAFKRGEDYDFDPNCEGCKNGTCLMHTGELHIAQAAWNALGLTSYYKYYPQGDDRLHNILETPKIGLDLDEVVINWIGPWTKKFGYPTPTDWDFSYKNKEHFESMPKEEMEEFYANLPAKIDPSELNFPFDCYVTARAVPVELTKDWLQSHGFPTKPVYSLGLHASKVDTIKNLGITHFIDDNYKTFIDLNKEGVAAFLLTTPHNSKYNVGYRRISSLKDFKDRFLW